MKHVIRWVFEVLSWGGRLRMGYRTWFRVMTIEKGGRTNFAGSYREYSFRAIFTLLTAAAIGGIGPELLRQTEVNGQSQTDVVTDAGRIS
jgi:hypothetical protein